MGAVVNLRKQAEESVYDIDLVADVLVIGGGPAGCWAGLAAARAGSRVVLVEKGYVGTSGTQAPSGTGAYYLKPDDPIQRKNMIESRLAIAHGFASLEWIEKVYDQSFINQDLMSRWGYAFPKAEDGARNLAACGAADAVLFLRKQLERHGVTILDHSPVLELLTSDASSRGGWDQSKSRQDLAREIGRRRLGDRWNGVPLRHGGRPQQYGRRLSSGCRSRVLNYPEWNSAANTELLRRAAPAPRPLFMALRPCGMPAGRLSAGAKARPLPRSKPATCIAYWTVMTKGAVRISSALNRMTFQFFERHLHIDPFTEQYEVEHLLEGTVRASGGIEVGTGAATTIPGLFAAGDTTCAKNSWAPTRAAPALLLRGRSRPARGLAIRPRYLRSALETLWRRAKSRARAALVCGRPGTDARIWMSIR